MSRQRRFVAVVLACGLSVATLSGCSQTVNLSAKADQPFVEAPALTRQQSHNVFTKITQELAAADKARDVKKLAAIAANPALNMRAMQYQLGGSAVKQLSFESDAFTPGTAPHWPRLLVAVTKPQKNAAAALMLMRQDDPRADYKLVSWGRIFPAERVEMSRTEMGAEQVHEDRAGFITTPKRAVDAYAKVVSDASKANALSIKPDRLMKVLQDEAKVLKNAVGSNGSVSWSVAPGEILGSVLMPDKSALVFATIITTTTVAKTKENARIQLGGSMGKLLGSKANIDKKVQLRRIATIALVVPASSSSAPIHVIAAELTPLDAKPL